MKIQIFTSTSALELDERKRLASKIGIHSLFRAAAKAARSSMSRLVYAERVWINANRELFNNQLKKPVFAFLKTADETHFKGLGQWNSSTRRLALSHRLFNSSEEIMCTTIVHEMCHSCVSEIDHVSDRTKQGHGPDWERWMLHCDLTPSRYNHDDRDNFLSEEELTNKKERKEAKEEAIQGRTPCNPNELRNDLPVQYFDQNRKEWVKGVLVGRYHQGMTTKITSHSWEQYWVFIEYASLGHHMMYLPQSSIYHQDGSTVYYTTKQWADMTANIRGIEGIQ